MANDVLELFHPAIKRWFSEAFAAPTPPQRLGWPHIAAGENTLILAPTGSGKTLAAFLCAIDAAMRVTPSSGPSPSGIHTLYLSPLKALANDIERNLEAPLRGIQACAESLGGALPELRVGVRTGDTPANERQKMVRKPPHLLITTPESLHLLLTSTRARDMLRSVRYVIVDEIHALCPNKRGTFLALLLERLEALAERSPVRIGLSATQRPLSEVARFLGGAEIDETERPVAIVDAGMRKSLDLAVQSPVEDMKALPREGDRAPSIWPSIYDRLIELVDEHESTLIFANSRRVVERIASEMNRRIGYERIQAHHGSISKERRHRIEQDLKAGRLPALVATSSMELGIDVGFIDLVCHVESPFSVAGGLQRVGRAGHLLRATSRGRLIPKTRADLLMSAAIARSMLRAEISSVTIPRNPLDVLAQQIVAMVAVDEWDVAALYERIRCAYPYRDLPQETFESVLAMISGRFRSSGMPVLRPRVSWDRATNRLYSLPGTRHAAILNGGVIPDSGQYAMVLDDGTTRLGELDEEFVFERRVGDSFVLGTGRWRIQEITNDRVIVSPCDEIEAMMPFWKGEGLGHDWEFGVRLGAFVRSCEERLSTPSLSERLREECALDEGSAEILVDYLREQRREGGELPTDRTVFVDVFRGESGDRRLAIISTFGRLFHMTLWLLVQHALREAGIDPPDAVYSDAGLLLRLGTVSPDAIMDVLGRLRSGWVTEAITRELENSPYFALRFRRNAGRALLLPKARPGRRTPLWLQRLRAHDLLSFASKRPGFPIVIETYRELLEDVLPLEGVRDFLRRVEVGEARFALRRGTSPSPFSWQLLLDFTTQHLYLDDRPVRMGRSARNIEEDLAALIGEHVQASEVLDNEAVNTIEERMQGTADFHRARNGTELVELLRRIGDLTDEELARRCEPDAHAALPDLLADGRVVRLRLSGTSIVERLVAAEDAPRYEQMSEEDVREMVERFVANHVVTSAESLRARYPVDARELDEIRSANRWIQVELPGSTSGWAHPQVLASVRRMSMSRRRRTIEPVAAETYQQFLLAHQHVAEPLDEVGLDDVISQLAGCRVPLVAWNDVLSCRVRGFRPELLDERVRDGMVSWLGGTIAGTRWLAFAGETEALGNASRVPRDELDPAARRIVEFLEANGASFLHHLASGLGEPPSKLAPELWDLIWAGWIVNDSLDPAFGDRPQPDRWQLYRRAPWGRGRWSVAGDREDTSEEAKRKEIRRLLDRYGVLTREIVAHDREAIPWRDAYPLLTRMEWAGEVDRAFFVSGLSGPQFAFHGVVGQLSHPAEDVGAVLIQVSDPANMYGDVIPIVRPDGERYVVRHHPANYLVMEGGRPVLGIENRGERLIPLDDVTATQRKACFRLLSRLVKGRERPSSMRVNLWDGLSVTAGPVANELAEAGFVREGQQMILYRTYD